MPRLLVKLLIAAALAGAVYYAWTHFVIGHGAGAGAGQSAPKVSVAEVIQRDVQEWHDFSGRLVAVNQVDVRPRVAGAIESVHFRDGQQVKKGDLLFIIDPRPYVAALASAQARADYAESEFARAERLMNESAIPQHDYDQRKNDAEVARADLATAKLNLDYTRVVSPIDGRASRAEITEGNLVEAGGTAPVLTTVVSNKPIYADFEVDEENFLRYVQAGSARHSGKIPVRMGLANEDGAPHEGRIESFDNRLDSASGTIRVRAVLDNDDGALVPGLFARVRLGNPQETSAVLIADRAVGTDQSKRFVYMVGDDDKVQYREVKLGDTADGLRIVQEGLKPGEKIIVDGLQRAHPGMTVAPDVVPMEAADSGQPTADKKEE